MSTSEFFTRSVDGIPPPVGLCNRLLTSLRPTPAVDGVPGVGVSFQLLAGLGHGPRVGPPVPVSVSPCLPVKGSRSLHDLWLNPDSPSCLRRASTSVSVSTGPHPSVVPDPSVPSSQFLGWGEDGTTGVVSGLLRPLSTSVVRFPVSVSSVRGHEGG